MTTDSSLLTVQQHILREQLRFSGASGEFSFLLSGITLATKIIQAQVRRAGLVDVLGEHGEVNVQGEIQQKLDVIANEAIVQALTSRASVGVLASEENEEAMIVHKGDKEAKYAVVFDPLDGSSNIDVNVSVGTTFSILRRPDDASSDNPEAWVLQPGSEQVAAGYVVYGSSTILVYSVGHGVHGFTLDPAIGAYVLSHPNMTMPERGKYYSVNEANADSFPEKYNRYLAGLRGVGNMAENILPVTSVRWWLTFTAPCSREGSFFILPPKIMRKVSCVYSMRPIQWLSSLNRQAVWPWMAKNGS